MKIVKEVPNLWRILKANKDEEWVTNECGEFGCTCRYFTIHRLTCRHISAVRNMILNKNDKT